MYAVIESGGKQLRVQAGDVVEIEKEEGETGSPLEFNRVLFFSKGGQSEVQIGKPLLEKAKVTGIVVGQGRGKKILVFKMKRRKDYRRTQGHRQPLTQVLITDLESGAGEKESLDQAKKDEILKKFRSSLKPKGPSQTPKTLGSRKRLAEKRVKEQKEAAPQSKE